MVSLRISDSLDVLSKFSLWRHIYGVGNSIVHHWSYTDITGQITPSPHPSIRCMLPWLRLFAVSLPLVRGGDKETIQLALIVSAISGAMSAVFAVTWPEDGSFGGAKEAEQAFALQNLFLTGLPLGAYFPCPRLWIESHLQTQGASRYAMVALQSTLAPIHSPLATLQHARHLRFLSTSRSGGTRNTTHQPPIEVLSTSARVQRLRTSS
jgi:hypothetical protein